jgi:hypothetical protein
MANSADVNVTKEQDLANREYVQKSYTLFLGREPEEKALTEYVEQLNRCTLTKAQFILLLTESAEYREKARILGR